MVSAWKTYLRKYNKGRGIVLLGHSQGSFVLRQLMADYVDKRPGVRKRLVGAYLFGGNVEVKEGSLVGGDFKHIPGCEAPKQIGCIAGFSTFNAPVPADSNFGRVGGRLSTGDPANRDILCVNPAAVGGGPAPLDSIFPSEPFAPGTSIGIATQAVGVPQPDVLDDLDRGQGRLQRHLRLQRRRGRAAALEPGRRTGAQRGPGRDLGPAPRRREHRARQRRQPAAAAGQGVRQADRAEMAQIVKPKPACRHCGAVLGAPL